MIYESSDLWMRVRYKIRIYEQEKLRLCKRERSRARVENGLGGLGAFEVTTKLLVTIKLLLLERCESKVFF